MVATAVQSHLDLFSMISSEFEEFVRKKQYHNSKSFNNSTNDLLRLINFIKQLPIEPESFTVIKDLIRFYRGSILLAFRPFYKKLEAHPDKDRYAEDAKSIAAYVKTYLGETEIEDLNFFYCMGISSKKKRVTDRSQAENEFMDYIEKLSKHISELKKNLNAMNAENLKLELDAILAEGLTRKLNPLEVFCEQEFKKEADRIYHQNKEKIEEVFVAPSKQKRPPQPMPERESDRVTLMCCRTSFIDQEIIKQPENLTIEYKNYSFPFDETRINILKKTFCGFLNTEGGTIYLGVHENIDTKKRKVLGMQLNESEKEDLLKSIRRIAESLSPDILTNKFYNVQFVPIRSSQPPNNYISGRFIVKIIIRYGQRDQIYSYRYDDKDYFSFRTENEVIHRDGREVLNAYRERLKNPLPIPMPIHEGPCAQPEEGSEIYGNSWPRKERAPPMKPVEKQRFREKDAKDYVILQIQEKVLLAALQKNGLTKAVQVTAEPKSNICFVKVVDRNQRGAVNHFMEQIQEKYEAYQIERGIELLDDPSNMGVLVDMMRGKNINFKIEGRLFCLSETEDAISAFLLLNEMKIRVGFLPI